MALQNTSLCPKGDTMRYKLQRTIEFEQALGVGKDREAWHPVVHWITKGQT